MKVTVTLKVCSSWPIFEIVKGPFSKNNLFLSSHWDVQSEFGSNPKNLVYQKGKSKINITNDQLSLFCHLIEHSTK